MYPELVGKAIPYGVYDVGANDGFVRVAPITTPRSSLVQRSIAWWNQVGVSNPVTASERHVAQLACGLERSRYAAAVKA